MGVGEHLNAERQYEQVKKCRVSQDAEREKFRVQENQQREQERNHAAPFLPSVEMREPGPPGSGRTPDEQARGEGQTQQDGDFLVHGDGTILSHLRIFLKIRRQGAQGERI